MTAVSPPSRERETELPVSLSSKLIRGVSTLGTATALERGLSFLANLSAARLGGASTFGAYSLALTTANNIASYAGAGIGSTATRFAGAYVSDESGRRTLARALTLVAVFSASLAALLLFAGAEPLARYLLHQAALAPLLRWAALPAASIILLECFRGYLVGQMRFTGLIWLSATVGCGYLAVLPALSRWGAPAMVGGFATVTAMAVVAVLLRLAFSRRREPSLHSAIATAGAPGLATLTRDVWKFGMVQLAGVVGLNAAGFWIASLIVRSDASMVEMGLFAAANQVRNIAALAPGLFTQTSFGLMADASQNASRVAGISSCAASLASLALAGSAIAVLPWVMPLAYGKSFHAAVLAGCFALATSIVHLSNGPASARLTMVSLPATTAINAVWSVVVFLAGTALLTNGPWRSQAAAAAMATYLAAHLLSAVLVALSLRRQGQLPSGLAGLLALPSLGAVALAVMAAAREGSSGIAPRLAWTAALLAVTSALGWAVACQGRRYDWAPQMPRSLSFVPRFFRLWERVR